MLAVDATYMSHGWITVYNVLGLLGVNFCADCTNLGPSGETVNGGPCVYKHEGGGRDHIGTLKIMLSMSEHGGLWKHSNNRPVCTKTPNYEVQ